MPLVPTDGALASEELELLKEEEIVSIATRYEQPISHAPSNVYVITDDDIRHSGAIDIPTILRRVPGLDVRQVTGADFNVSARGDNQLFANKILVMIDGRSVYIDGQGLVFWKSLPVTLLEIKRIEVLKGPASVLYGFNAFDGVINIITKSAQELKGTTLQFGGGELGTMSSAAVHAGWAGKFDYRLSIGRDQTQQWRNNDALAFRSHKLNVQTQYNFSADASLRVAGGFIDTNRFDGPVSNIQISRSQFNQAYTDVHYQFRTVSIRGWMSIAAKEARETIDWLRLLQAAKMLDGSSLDGLVSGCAEVLTTLNSISTTRTSLRSESFSASPNAQHSEFIIRNSKYTHPSEVPHDFRHI